MCDHVDAWDFAHQEAETAASVAMLRAEAGLDETARITLDLTFRPADAGADPAPLLKALRSFGYAAREMEADGMIEAQVADLPFTYEAIHLHEDRTSRLALARGYLPDGWGFWEP